MPIGDAKEIYIFWPPSSPSKVNENKNFAIPCFIHRTLLSNYRPILTHTEPWTEVKASDDFTKNIRSKNRMWCKTKTTI